jgi:hypothetical protein
MKSIGAACGISRRPWFAVVLFVGTFAITGCVSHDPVDYLPAASAYMGVNGEKLRSGDGGKRLLNALEKMTPQGDQLSLDKLSQLYVSMTMPSPGAKTQEAYAVATGDAGFADQFISRMKSEGAASSKMQGMSVVTSGTMSIAQVGSKGLLFFKDSPALETMVNVSSKKAPAASNTALFKSLKSQLGEHGVVFVADAQPLVAAGQAQTDHLAAINAEGTAALRKVQTIFITFDWQDKPVLAMILQLPDEKSAKDLTDMGNSLLAMGKMALGSKMPPELAPIVNSMEAKSEGTTASITIVVPQAQAESFLTKLESRGTGVFQNPASPDQGRKLP